MTAQDCNPLRRTRTSFAAVVIAAIVTYRI